MTDEDNHLNNHQKQTYCLTKKNTVPSKFDQVTFSYFLPIQ